MGESAQSRGEIWLAVRDEAGVRAEPTRGVDERRSLGRVAFAHQAEEQRVIPGRRVPPKIANDEAGCSVQAGQAVAPDPAHAGEAALHGPRERQRELRLVMREHIDREASGARIWRSSVDPAMSATEISGGSSESDAKEETVAPAGSSPSHVVTTVTGAGTRLISVLKLDASMDRLHTKRRGETLAP